MGVVPKLELNVPDCPAALAVKLPPFIKLPESTNLLTKGDATVVSPPKVVEPSTLSVPLTDISISAERLVAVPNAKLISLK